MMNSEITTIDSYIESCDEPIRPILHTIRETIKQAAPGATEAIKYAMPTFVLNGNLVHFAAHKNHIGFYPAPSALIAFNNEIEEYKSSKGAVQFPLNKPIPYELIEKMVHFRVSENLAKTRKKK
jgi:uncharacterized protein YdhG (YjbR/CyaY superfamily)